MTKFTAWLIRGAPAIVNSGWLFVCIFASEMEIIRTHCTTAFIVKGVAVGMMIWFLSGHFAVRLYIWLDERRQRKQNPQL